MQTQQTQQPDSAEAMLYEAESLLMEVLGDIDHLKRSESLFERIREYKKQRGLA